MPTDLSGLLDQLEEWLQAQVPPNLGELPGKMLETVERVSNEIIDSLSMHGPPSISIPFPPFGGKEAPSPAPVIEAPASAARKACGRAGALAGKHPLATSAGIAVALAVGVGAAGVVAGVGPFAHVGKEWRLRRKFGTRGVVEDGMLKEAIVILAPSPTPPLLVPLAASLLKAGYVVLIAVPQVKEAEVVERRLSGLQEKTALRVLIYDPEDPSTFPPFHRSLLATLTLRFAAPGPGRASVGAYAAGDPYNPQPTHIPHIHAFVSLYALNPAPPSQPGALPALPTLVAPVQGGKTPALVSLYPAASVLTSAETFASQVLAANHRLLAANLGASSDARVVSVYVGDVALPTLPAIITEGRALSRRELARQRLRDAARTPTATLSLLRDVFSGFVSSIYRSVLYTLGIGSAARDYSAFEARMLRILKARSCATNYVGQRAWLPTTLQVVPARALPRVLALLPPLPAETGPAPPPPPKFTSEERDAGKDKKRSVSVSSRSVSSSSEHDGEDLASSIHTAGTTQSTQSSADGLDGSWVGLEHER